MSAVGDLVVNFLGNVKPFQQSVQHMARLVKSFGTQTKSGMSSAMGSIGDTLAKRAKSIGSMAGGALAKAFKWAVIGGLVGLATAAIGGAAWSVKLASDLEETQSKFNVVFRNVQAEAMETAEELRKYLGQSTLETLRGMADLGDTFKPLGFAERDAMKMAAAVTRLAGDLSSFSNMDYSEAFERLQGTLIGNHENALRFGVVINEASLKAKMAQLGINGLSGAIDNQAKVLARYAILMEGTSDAHGDLGRTAGSFANTIRRLWSQVQELATQFGQVLLPVATAVGDVFSAVGEKLNDVARGALPEVGSAVSAIANSIRAIADGVRGIEFTSWQEGLGKVFDLLRGGFREIATAIGELLMMVAERFGRRLQIAALEAFQTATNIDRSEVIQGLRNVTEVPLARAAETLFNQAGRNIAEMVPKSGATLPPEMRLPDSVTSLFDAMEAAARDRAAGITPNGPMGPQPYKPGGFDVAAAAAELAKAGGQDGPSKKMKAAAEQLFLDVTPGEKFRREWGDIKQMADEGLIDQATQMRAYRGLIGEYGPKSQPVEFAGLATKNSVEAYKAVIGAQARAETAAEKTQLKTLPEMVTQLQRINEQLSREGWEI